MLGKDVIESLEQEHLAEPHLRKLQRALAGDITARVHSPEDLKAAEEATEILFGKGTTEALFRLSEKDLLSVFEGVPQVTIPRTEVETGINVIEFFADKTNIFSSRGEARKMIIGGGVHLNKNKIEEIDRVINNSDIIKGKYILAQKGKKNYYLITLE